MVTLMSFCALLLVDGTARPPIQRGRRLHNLAVAWPAQERAADLARDRCASPPAAVIRSACPEPRAECSTRALAGFRSPA